MGKNAIPLRGHFWGDRLTPLGSDQLFLSIDDCSRGLLVLGLPGTGKTQAIILPLIAEHMTAGHSLIVCDPQGELAPYLRRMAAATGHWLAVHDPTTPDCQRFNLAQDLHTVSDARAISAVLVPVQSGDNRFWSDAATALLAACMLRFGNLGQIFTALADLRNLANVLGQIQDDACYLAGSFLAGVRHGDWRVSSSIASVLSASLSGWAALNVRQATASSDFDAWSILRQRAVVILTCPGRVRDVFAPYLGAVLCRLVLDLDTIGQQAGGPLPFPVALVLDEFPTLGRQDSLLTNINLTRKRNMALVAAAQSRSQLQFLYGQAGAEVLFCAPKAGHKIG